MSTNITINVSGNRLLRQSREAQTANRQQLTQKEVDDKFLADVRQIEAAELARQRDGAVPEYRVVEQTSAQRGGTLAASLWSETTVGDTVTITVRNAENTHSTTSTYDFVRIPLPDNRWFPNAIGSEVVQALEEADPPANCEENSPITDSTVGIFRAENFSTDGRFDRAVFALPLGDRDSILVYNFRQIAIATHRQTTITTTRTWTWAEGDIPFTGSCIPSGTSVVDEVITPTNTGQEFTKCFYVSNNGVKEIDAPAGLLAAIANKSQPFATYPTQPDGNDGMRRIDPPEPENFREYIDAIPGLICYGIGALDTTYHQRVNNATFYSPAIFTFLSQIDQTLLADYNGYYSFPTNTSPYALNLQYSTIRNTYLTNPAPPAEFIGPNILSGGSALNSQFLLPPVDRKINFNRATVAPVAHNIALAPPSNYSTGNKKLTLVAMATPPYVLYSWNWGKPAYCRSQLIALGFTPADLTP